jgi:fructokinase
MEARCEVISLPKKCRTDQFRTTQETFMSSGLFGAIEAGGTKFLVAVGDDPINPRDVCRIPTSNDPQETMAAVTAYFQLHAPLDALAVASFGPVDFARGAIGKTPKLAWQNFPVVDTLIRALNLPVVLETDVNGAAVGESLYGAGKGVGTFVYITVGTGIGAGVVINGQTLHGLLHPEVGHLLVRRHPDEPSDFGGACPFHGECLEGMASGPAMKARWGRPAETLSPDHPAWRMEAFYIAQACLSLACVVSPHRIVVGGGVFSNTALYEMVNAELARLVNGYLPLPEVVPPELPLPALTGALAMARAAAWR